MVTTQVLSSCDQTDLPFKEGAAKIKGLPHQLVTAPFSYRIREAYSRGPNWIWVAPDTASAARRDMEASSI